MKKLISLIMALVLVLSCLSVYASAESMEIHIQDAYVYEYMRGKDGQFHEITVLLGEDYGNGPGGWYGVGLELNSSAFTASGEIFLSDTQQTAPWEVGGSYPVYYGEGKSFNVEVLQNPFEIVAFLDGYAFYDEDAECFTYNPGILIRYNNGDETVIRANESHWLYPGNYGLPYYDYGYYAHAGYRDTQEGEPWVVGNTYRVYTTFMNQSATINVTAVAVESVEVETVEFVENTGDWEGYWDENDIYHENAWMYYDAEPEYITVTLTDGTVITGDRYEVGEELGLNVCYETNQSHEAPWGLGEYTVILSIGSYVTDYTVRIVETPVDCIEVRDVERFFGDGDLIGYTDENGEYIDSWIEYNAAPQYLTVTFKDGTVVSGDRYEIEDETGYWVNYETDQSYENQWGLGEHTATLSFCGYTCEYTVRITDTIVKSIEIKDVEWIHGTGMSEGHWDENGEYVEGSWMSYDAEPWEITVTFKDGTVVSGDRYEIERETGYLGSYDSDQSYENPWGLGEHTATFSLCGFTQAYTVRIVESPVESIEIEDVSVFLGDGSRQEEWQDGELLGTWMEYYVLPRHITVTLKDGTVIEGTASDLEEAMDNKYYVNYRTDQSFQNQWGLGEHTATLLFCGLEQDYTVQIVENPIESIEVEDVVRIFGNGDETTTDYWDDYGNYYEETWMTYDAEPKKITVTYKDGTVVSGDRNELEEETGYWAHCETDQSFENQWGVGEHTATLTFCGFPCEYTVRVVDTLVESIEIEEVEVIQGTGSLSDYWDEEEGNYYENAWMEYDVSPEKITVTYKDGTVYTGSYYDLFWESDYEISYETDQSYENQWGLGVHTATLTYCGFSQEYTVRIVETPIKSIEVEDVEWVLGGGYMEGYWDEEDNYISNAWMYYDEDPLKMTVTYKDGTVISGDRYEIEWETDYEYSVNCFSDQSYENQWGLGEHTATLSFCGYTCEYTVRIVESPIESIEIPDVHLTEGLDGSYDFGDGYFHYYTDGIDATVKFKDGTEQYGDYVELGGRTYWLRIDSGNQYEEHWEAGGTYPVSAELLGAETTFKITIDPTPVQSVVFADQIVYEGIDGGSEDYYHVSPQLAEVVMKDGTTAKFEDGYIYYNDKIAYARDDFWDRQNEESLEAGNTYTANAYILGVLTTFNVTVAENPIESVELVKQPDKTQYLVNEYLDMKGAVLRLNYTDGSYEEFTVDDHYTATYRRNFTAQKINRWSALYLWDCVFEEAGWQIMEGEFFGKTFEIPVTAKQNLVESISIRENADKSITVSVFNSDNTGYNMTLLDIPYSCAYYDEYDSVFTDKGQFRVRIFSGEDFFALGLYDRNGDTVRSNVLFSCDWYEAATFLDWRRAEDIYAFNTPSTSFNGTVTAGNIDAVIEAAAALDDLWSDSDRVDHLPDSSTPNGYYCASSAVIEEVVKKYFVVEELDLTLSENYDPETDLYKYLDPAMGGGETMKSRPDQITYSDGVWSITLSIDETTALFKINEEGKYVAIVGETNDGSETLYGDVNGDGQVTVSDAVTLLRVLGGTIDRSAIDEKAADVVKDGAADPLNTADAVQILKYLVGAVPSLKG